MHVFINLVYLFFTQCFFFSLIMDIFGKLFADIKPPSCRVPQILCFKKFSIFSKVQKGLFSSLFYIQFCFFWFFWFFSIFGFVHFYITDGVLISIPRKITVQVILNIFKYFLCFKHPQKPLARLIVLN